ncbi:aminotransferase class I/II-fold pyridoxal phosphate-dependent enzyme [uncultured Jannaschia sp.]|uniref:DegT/DnrJ/EryC1/StrS family aminotransferase n=1 Tax=uncultured Jannaschia sp. TaxID=293347 RepID=UPI00260B2BEB|nr:aminotransferase class I/II-fold pyridoxal phosphate-dependent enzyme [uncultured Jannaschia sp.]
MRILLSKPHMGGTEIAHVQAAFDANFIAPAGPQLEAFEAAIAARLGHGVHCVGLSSGSAALHLALRIAGVTRGDEVWTTSMNFAGGVFPVLYEGATPVFFDLSPASWTIDTDLLEAALRDAATAGTLPKVIVPTDLYGQSANLAAIEALAVQHGVRVVVDSAESLGATIGGRPAGTGGDAAILSFNGNKIITTSGGGMLVTRHADWADRARFLATQARDPAPHYEHSTYGYNYRLSNVCAAIGLGQLDVLDARIAARRAIFARYADALTPLGVRMMPEPDGHRSTHWLTALALPEGGPDRERMRRTLADHGIEARPLWKPMHLQPLFAGARYVGQGVDEDLFSRGLCLPSGSDLTRSEQDEVIGRVSDLLSPG